MLKKILAIAIFLGATSLAACGGGTGGGYGAGRNPYSPPTMSPTTSPSSNPQSSGNAPTTQTVGSGAAFVNTANNHTLYFLDVDTSTGSACTGGCLGVWPVMAPASGSTASNGFTIITRSDGTGQQWAYNGFPVYMFAGDSGPDQANGDGISADGGHWHVARPAASPTSSPTTSPTSTPGGGGGGTGY